MIQCQTYWSIYRRQVAASMVINYGSNKGARWSYLPARECTLIIDNDSSSIHWQLGAVTHRDLARRWNVHIVFQNGTQSVTVHRNVSACSEVVQSCGQDGGFSGNYRKWRGWRVSISTSNICCHCSSVYHNCCYVLFLLQTWMLV